MRRLPLVLFGLVFAAFATAGQGEVTARRLMNLLHERLLLSRQIAMARYNAGPTHDELLHEEQDIPVDTRPRETYIDRILTTAHQNHEFAYRVVEAQINAGEIAQRLFLAKWKRENHPKFNHVPSLATSKQRAKDLDLAIARMSGKQALGTSWRLFKSAAAKVRFPKVDRDCFNQAWKTAILPTASP